MTLNLTNLLAQQMTGYITLNQPLDVDTLKKITYVTAANGVFRVEKTPIGIFKSKESDIKATIPGLLEMEEGVDLLIPKIPFKYLMQMLSWYIDVQAQDGCECSTLFFWNHNNVQLATRYSDNTEVKGLTVDGQLIMYTPVQTNSTTLSEFHKDPMVDWLRKECALVAEFHSH